MLIFISTEKRYISREMELVHAIPKSARKSVLFSKVLGNLKQSFAHYNVYKTNSDSCLKISHAKSRVLSPFFCLMKSTGE